MNKRSIIKLINFSLSDRESRALKNQKKDVLDDANDFNDDFSIYDALSKSQSEGNLSDDARGKKGKKGNRQSGISTGGGVSGIYDDDSGFSSFGYGGSKGNFIFTSHLKQHLNTQQQLYYSVYGSLPRSEKTVSEMKTHSNW